MRCCGLVADFCSHTDYLRWPRLIMFRAPALTLTASDASRRTDVRRHALDLALTVLSSALCVVAFSLASWALKIHFDNKYVLVPARAALISQARYSSDPGRRAR